MSASLSPSAAEHAPSSGQSSRSLTLGVVAMAPLFAAYEVALATRDSAPRNAAELFFSLTLRPFGEHLAQARWAALCAVALAAAWLARRRSAAILPGVARIVLEALLAACLVGPLMVVGVHSFAERVPSFQVAAELTAPGPSLGDTALALGAGAWEELFFRVGLYSFVYWLALRFCTACFGAESHARALADALGLCVSSTAFAAAHFGPVLERFGFEGPPFEATRFAWLALGGALLGLLFRWRGPGVAAWTHGLFNVALWVGIDPDVIW